MTYRQRLEQSHARLLHWLEHLHPHVPPVVSEAVQSVINEAREVSAEKKPRLFYWEPAEDCWSPVTDEMRAAFDQVYTFEHLDEDEEIKITFKRQDMTDQEFDAIPEE